MPPQTTAPPFFVAASARGTSAPTGAKISAASSGSGEGASESLRRGRAEREREFRRRLIARPHECVNALALSDRNLSDDMGGGAEAVDADRFRRTRHLQRAPADETRAQQRRERRRIAGLGQRKTVGRVGDGMGRIAAIARVAGEERIVAQIFARAQTVGAMPAGMAKPGNADPLSKRETGHARTDRLDAPDDFVAWNDRKLRLGQFAVDDMEIGAANAARLDLEPHFADAGRRDRPLLHDERRVGPRQDHGFHDLRHSRATC